MNPERQLERLRDEDRWDLAPLERRVLPDAPVGGSASRRVLTPVVAGIVAVAAAGALLIAGLSIRGAADRPSVPSTSTDAPIPAEPTQDFGGDCGSIMSTDDLADYLGGTISAKTIAMDDAGNVSMKGWAVRQYGGIQCRFVGADGARVSFSVVPSSAVPDLNEYLCELEPGMEEKSTHCSFAHVAGARIIWGVVETSEGTSAKSAARHVEELFDRASSATPIPERTLPGDAWSIPIDCDALAARLSFDRVVESLVHYRESDGRTFGIDEQLLGEHPGSDCSWWTLRPGSEYETAVASIASYGGGAWAIDAFASGPDWRPSSIDGFDEVRVRAVQPDLAAGESEGERFTFVARTGSNLLSMTVVDVDARGIEAFEPLLQTAAETLDAR
jgi:hypothetical protein